MKDKYFDNAKIGSSAINCLLKKTAKEYKAIYIDESVKFESKSMAFGTALHTRILEPLNYPLTVAECPAGMKLTTKECKAWKADNMDKIRLNATESETVAGIERELKTNKLATYLLENVVDIEAEHYAKDEKTGFDLRSK